MAENDGSPFERMIDEIELQAWLARAEFRNPSLHDPSVQGEVSALAKIRDELRLQVALGKLDARDELHVVEEHWRKMKHVAEEVVEEAGEGVHDLLARIRDGYRHLTK